MSVVGAGLAGCIGQIGDDENPAPPPETTVSGTLVCDPSTAPSPTPLIRLSRLQYDNTLADLLAHFGIAEALTDAAVVEQLSQFPEDGEEGESFSLMDGRLAQRHVETYYGVADALASALTDDPARLEALLGACGQDSPVADTCLSDFVAQLGRLAFRRPLDESEITRLMELNEPAVPTAEVVRRLVFQILMSPQLNYHLELEGEPQGDDDHLTLSGYALAARLSYHFWQSMPDAALLDAAASGALDTDDGYRAEIERLFTDPRTRETVRRLYSEWYRLDAFGGFATSPAFESFSDGVQADDALHEAMVAEIEALTDHYTWDTQGSYADLLSSDLILTESSALASLYGVTPWDGNSEPSRFSAERSGLLTRAAFLVTSNERTNPFRRGAYLTREILCEPLSLPDPNNLPADALDEPDFDPEKSTRERFEAKTAAAECQSCHGSFNPPGFALEAYDALGRHRSEETIYDEDGTLIATVPVDSSIEFRVDDKKESFDGPVALMDAIAASGRAETCFARHYFRFTYRRAEDEARDSCALVTVREALVDGGGIRAALKAVALEPAFRTHIIDREEP